MPSEQDPNLANAHLRGAEAAAFRLFTLYLGLRIVDLAFMLLGALITQTTDVETQSPLVAPLMRLLVETRLGEGWLRSFILLMIVDGLIKIGLALWVWRMRSAPMRRPGLLLVIGIAGLAATIAQPIVGMSLASGLSWSEGAEALAAFSVAASVSSTAATVLNVFVLGGFLAMLFLQVSAEKEPTPKSF